MNFRESSELLGLALGFASAVMFVLWCVQLRTRDATLVDVAWAANLALIAILYAVLAPGLLERRVLVALMEGSAMTRLALHLYVDRGRKGVEDGRYRALRSKWAAGANRNFFVFYQAQALLDVLLSIPFLLACGSAAPLGAFELVALGLWLVGVVGETFADRELAAFRAQPENRGRTCRVGLWSVSRHPNYFFQWLTWCAYAALAWTAPLGWIGLASPLVMLVLIVFVSGIPPTEEQALRSRGDDYREYQRTTSAFVPWFRKSRATRRAA